MPDQELLNRYRAITGKQDFKPESTPPRPTQYVADLNSTPEISNASRISDLRNKYQQVLSRKTLSPIHSGGEDRSTRSDRSNGQEKIKSNALQHQLQHQLHPQTTPAKLKLPSRNSSLRRNQSSASSIGMSSQISDLSNLKDKYRKTKKREKINSKLEEEYHDLLQKYAEAENTIDELRLGVTVDLSTNMTFQEGFTPNASRNHNIFSPREKDLQQTVVRPNMWPVATQVDGENLNSGHNMNVGNTTTDFTETEPDTETESEYITSTDTEQIKKPPAVFNADMINAQKSLSAAVKEIESEIDMYLEDNSREIDSDGIQNAVGEIEKDYMTCKDHWPQNFDKNHQLMSDVARLGRKLQSVLNKLYVNLQNTNDDDEQQTVVSNRMRVKQWLNGSDGANEESRFDSVIDLKNVGKVDEKVEIQPKKLSSRIVKNTSSVSSRSRKNFTSPSRIPIRVHSKKNLNLAVPEKHFSSTKDSGVELRSRSDSTPSYQKPVIPNANNSNENNLVVSHRNNNLENLQTRGRLPKGPMTITVSSKKRDEPMKRAKSMMTLDRGSNTTPQRLTERRTSTSSLDRKVQDELERTQEARESEVRRNEDLVDEMRRLKYDVEKMLEKQASETTSAANSVKDQNFNQTTNQQFLNRQFTNYSGSGNHGLGTADSGLVNSGHLGSGQLGAGNSGSGNLGHYAHYYGQPGQLIQTPAMPILLQSINPGIQASSVSSYVNSVPKQHHHGSSAYLDVSEIKNLRSEVKHLRKQIQKSDRKSQRDRSRPRTRNLPTTTTDEIYVIAAPGLEIQSSTPKRMVRTVSMDRLVDGFGGNNMSIGGRDLMAEVQHHVNQNFMNQQKSQRTRFHSNNSVSSALTSATGTTASQQRLLDAFQRAESAAAVLAENSHAVNRNSQVLLD